jgi:CubicO group peptidase (beta-lactamase class C family)
MMGSVGQFSWPGASGTDRWADPKEDLVVIYFSAAPGPIRWHYLQKIDALVYQAIATSTASRGELRQSYAARASPPGS